MATAESKHARNSIARADPRRFDHYLTIRLLAHRLAARAPGADVGRESPRLRAVQGARQRGGKGGDRAQFAATAARESAWPPAQPLFSLVSTVSVFACSTRIRAARPLFSVIVVDPLRPPRLSCQWPGLACLPPLPVAPTFLCPSPRPSCALAPRLTRGPPFFGCTALIRASLHTPSLPARSTTCSSSTSTPAPPSPRVASSSRPRSTFLWSLRASPGICAPERDFSHWNTSWACIFEE